MPLPILFSCQNITKSFGSRPLFEQLSFTVHEGDHIGLVGPNGAGKSTLLKILAGLEIPDSGDCIRRKNIQIGYVPQNPMFSPGKTLKEIVAEGIDGKLTLDQNERDQRVAVALSRVGCTFPTAITDTLSGGWRTRLAIAQALIMAPNSPVATSMPKFLRAWQKFSHNICARSGDSAFPKNGLRPRDKFANKVN